VEAERLAGDGLDPSAAAPAPSQQHTPGDEDLAGGQEAGRPPHRQRAQLQSQAFRKYRADAPRRGASRPRKNRPACTR
jgi:hypothetical protein